MCHSRVTIRTRIDPGHGAPAARWIPVPGGSSPGSASLLLQDPPLLSLLFFPFLFCSSRARRSFLPAGMSELSQPQGQDPNPPHKIPHTKFPIQNSPYKMPHAFLLPSRTSCTSCQWRKIHGLGQNLPDLRIWTRQTRGRGDRAWARGAATLPQTPPAPGASLHPPQAQGCSSGSSPAGAHSGHKRWPCPGAGKPVGWDFISPKGVQEIKAAFSGTI